MLWMIEDAGVFAGYLEDPVLHAEDAPRRRSSWRGQQRDIGPLRETHPPRGAWFGGL